MGQVTSLNYSVLKLLGNTVTRDKHGNLLIYEVN